MKKSLIALACLSALPFAASAANVELYGTVDTYIAVNHGNGDTDVSLASGGASASFWGIKGTEELSNGLQAIFKLESAFLTDTGTFPDGAGDNGLFSREAWVGLNSTTWGTLSFGRQYTPHFLTWAMTDPTDLSLGSSYSPFFFPMPTGVNGEVSDSLVRHDNSVLYVSPRMAGLQLFAYAALGEEKDSSGNITGSEDGNVYNIAANYVNGPLFVMASVLYQDYSGNNATGLGYVLDGTDGDPKDNPAQTKGHGMYYNLGVTYDFGVTKLSGAFMYKDGEDTPEVPDFWVAQIGAATPVFGGRWSVSASMLSNETQDDADAYSFGTRFDYPLSKRTKVYVGYEYVVNDDNAKYSIEAGPDSSLHYANEFGENQGQFFMGINHKF